MKTLSNSILRLCVLLSVLGYTGVAQSALLGGQAVPSISSRDLWQWFLALLLVLGIFLVCVWLLRRSGAIAPVSNVEKMRVISAVSLGMREKVVLLRVGTKQLVLAVTPGRIETLAVLEGDACLVEDTKLSKSAFAGDNFAQKLMQAIKGYPDV